MTVTRKFISIILLFFAFSLFLRPLPASSSLPHRAATGHVAANKARRAGGIGETFVGEKAVYDIGFWIFSKVAVGEVSLAREEGGYAATLRAYTTGFVDRIFQHREDVYVAHLKEIEGGGRFITKSFEKTIDINGRIRHGITEVDYEKRVVRWRSWGGGKEEKSGEDTFPEGIYCDDPLGAFYNFRFGVYGPAGEGESYKIYTFPDKDRVQKISLKITTGEDYKKRSAPEKPPSRYLADVKMDKDILGSVSGELEIHFTDKLLPLEAVAKDVAFFGDVHGTLREITGGNASAEVKGAADTAAETGE